MTFPVLVEYLVERYAKKAGKRITKITKKTLELFQAYACRGIFVSCRMWSSEPLF